MDSRRETLRDRCRVSGPLGGDRFVGVRAEDGRVEITFPMGFHLPEAEREVRREILLLLSLLQRLTDRRERVLPRRPDGRQQAETPVGAYLAVMEDYLDRRGYFTEREPVYRTGDRGRTDWGRTFRRQRPLLQQDLSPVYLKRTIRAASPNTRQLITRIHQYCVYESFEKLGWLFTAELPRPCALPLPAAACLAALRGQLGRTFIDRDKRLFSAMIAMLEYLGQEAGPGLFCYGTDRFEYVWERLIDKVFGAADKADYFPRASWRLRQGGGRMVEALRPDTVMRRDGKFYVLDAKYYRYGLTANPLHLPEGSSIHKQITYGEYISTRFGGQKGEESLVYNAFLLPYDAADNPLGAEGAYACCGEAVGWWKSGQAPYEHVQGILVDVAGLMHAWRGSAAGAAEELAEAIESALAENRRLFPETAGDKNQK